MNALLIFSVILVCNQLVLASKKPDPNSLLFFSQQSTNNCKSSGLQCKDCQTIQYCSSKLDSIFEIHCEDQSRLRPYCDMETNTCVKDQPAVCEIPDTSFHCPGTGYYPDLESCTDYHICDENRVPTKMSCPSLTNWDQGEKTCKQFYCRSYSPKLGQCKGKTNKLVAYAADKNMYVLCLSNGPILFQCPNKWEVFDEAEVTCKFECTQNGYFPNPSDPRMFYSCTKVGKGYESVVLECPEGYEFAELGPGQGICTYATTTTTSTTEAPTTIEDLTTILLGEENSTTDLPEEPNNEEVENTEAEEEAANNEETENNPEEAENNPEEAENNPEEAENNPEETENNPKEIENNPEEEHHSEESVIVPETNNDEHHSEETVDKTDENIVSEDVESETNNSEDHSIVEENHEESVHETEEITGEVGTDEIKENNESQMF